MIPLLPDVRRCAAGERDALDDGTWQVPLLGTLGLLCSVWLVLFIIIIIVVEDVAGFGVLLAEEAGVAVAHGEFLDADFAAFSEGGAEGLGVGDEDDLGMLGGFENEIGEGGEDGFVEAGLGFVEDEERGWFWAAEDGGEADELQSAV